MAKRREQVPAEPFARWLNDFAAKIAADNGGDVRGAFKIVMRECGWGDGGAAQRKFYRFRKQRWSGSINGVKGEFDNAKYFPREPVEEALHHAGVPFHEIYPDIAAAEEPVIEPEGWCPGCQDMVHPINGLCPWCEWRIAPRTGQVLQGKIRDRSLLRRKRVA